MEGFSLDAAVLTRQELSAVLTGLRSLDSVSKAPASDLLAAKLGADTDIPRDMEIDLASFYKTTWREDRDDPPRRKRDAPHRVSLLLRQRGGG